MGGVHFWRISQKKSKWRSWVFDFRKRSNFKAFFRHSTSENWKILKQKVRVGYVYIEESFDTTFNIGRGHLTFRILSLLRYVVGIGKSKIRNYFEIHWKLTNGKTTKVQQLDFFRFLDHLLENCKTHYLYCKKLTFL